MIRTITKKTLETKPAPRAEEPSRWNSWFAKFGLLPLIVVALLVFFTIAAPGFLELGNITNVLRQSTYLLLISLGQMVVLLCAKLDLSVGPTAALTSVVTALLIVNGDGSLGSIILGIMAGLGVGLGVGLFNGLIVAYARVPAFMATLGTASIATGLALILSNGAPVIGLPPAFSDVLGTGRLFGVPIPIIIAALVAMIMYVVLSYTELGRGFYAVGGNEDAARVAGIRVQFVVIMAFVVCSLLTSVAGVLLTARVASGEANLGASFVLLSIAAAVLGGTSLFGGEGRLSMVVLGVLFLGMLTNGMNLMQISSYVQEVVLGLVLIAAIAIDRLRAKAG